MFRSRTLIICFGIILASGIFASCAPPPCTDDDGDGYGSIESPDISQCTIANLVDCDDTDPDIHPGADEGENFPGTCDDGIDNDCDDAIDSADFWCDPCYDDDGDGFGTELSIHCTYSTLDCDDDPSDDPLECDSCTCGDPACTPCARCININSTEGPLGHASCTDGVDNECDGLTDLEEEDCIPCEDVDGDGYGINGSINCPNPGMDCDDNNDQIFPGQVEEDFGSPSCGDGIDNDCDALVDLADGACFSDNMMVDILAGTFLMGDHHDNCPVADQCPVHEVTLSAFSIDVHEVTHKEYSACVDAGACQVPSVPPWWLQGYDYYNDPAYTYAPVVNVNWAEAQNYCTWRGKRLPTEAEWEYAARGEIIDNVYYRYATGTNDLDGSQANFLDSGDPYDNDLIRVGTYAPNSYNLFNMTGNVSEWVSDWYSATYYSESPAVDPQGPATGTHRVKRGGPWSAAVTSNTLKVAYRGFGTPGTLQTPSGTYNNTIGFRCAKDIP